MFINEWLAQNATILADPMDDQFEDWIELYNAESSPVDLGGYYLTDTLTNKTRWKIPDNTVIPAHGYLLIWADDDNGQNNATNSDRHTNFQLSAGGEEIGLFTESGLQVDAVVFGPQLNDVSQGRYPDGGGAIYAMTTPTPRAANNIGVANEPPVLGTIGPRSAVEGQTLNFTVTASDPNPGDTLAFTLDPGAPAGASITPAGAFSWAPTEAQGGASYTVTVRVTDNGAPALDDFEAFTINVLKTNAPPVLDTINNHTVVEKQPLAFAVTATDPDLPAQNWAFSLDPGAPPGASITPAGNFTWTPTEAQGPGQYPVVVRVTDDGEPPLSSFQVVVLFVTETNEPPVLTAISDRTVVPGDLVTFTNSATDGDLPPNLLTYSLGPGAPADASIVPLTGVFAWPVPAGQPAGTNPVTITVTDNGTPPLSHSRAFAVVVGAPLRITNIVEMGGSVTITAPAVPGRTYTLEASDVLGAPSPWPAVGQPLTATNTTVIFSDPITNSRLFYRLRLSP